MASIQLRTKTKQFRVAKLTEMFDNISISHVTIFVKNRQ